MGNCFPCCENRHSAPSLSYEDLVSSADLGQNHQWEAKHGRRTTNRMHHTTGAEISDSDSGYTSL